MASVESTGIDLWHTDIPIAEQAWYLQQGLTLLSGEQQQQILRYRQLSDQLLHLLGRLLVRRYLLEIGKPLDWQEWQVSHLGKPFVKSGPQFNLSHAGTRVVAAFSTHPIGVDLEVEQSLDATMFIRYLHPAEQAFVREAANPTTAFFTVWTRKEALLKALGIGISKQLTVHNCLLARITYPADHSIWHLHSLPASTGYFQALATPLSGARWRSQFVPATKLLQFI
jgi:4'-phosphopantetheinyl transferase